MSVGKNSVDQMSVGQMSVDASTCLKFVVARLLVERHLADRHLAPTLLKHDCSTMAVDYMREMVIVVLAKCLSAEWFRPKVMEPEDFIIFTTQDWAQ